MTELYDNFVKGIVALSFEEFIAVKIEIVDPRLEVDATGYRIRTLQRGRLTYIALIAGKKRVIQETVLPCDLAETLHDIYISKYIKPNSDGATRIHYAMQ